MERHPIGQDALDLLQDYALVQPLTVFDRQIEAFIAMDEHSPAAKEELQNIERQLKTVDVRRRHARDDAQKSRILKSRTDKWEDANREQSLGRAHEQLRSRRHQIVTSQRESDEQLSTLQEQIDREARLRHGRWIAPVAIGLTRSLVFLYEELSEMNVENFIGRSLSDVLKIGPLLG